MTEAYHIPVLQKEAIEFLITYVNGKYVDATLGGGGHSEKILELISSNGKLVAIDADSDAILFSEKRLEKFSNKILVHDNFRNLKTILEKGKTEKVNGVLFDLGISSYQIDDESKGFSFRGNARLDFRMNREQELDGYTIINEYDESELADIFFYFGEERNSRRIARRIIEERKLKPISTTEELKILVQKCVGGKFLNKSLARIFQAVRIAVNDELESLKQALEQAIDVLLPTGRIVVISYHSLEDRIVKQMFQANAKNESPRLMILTRKVFLPSEEELKTNPRSRSAKMRVAEKLP
ncbi:MAG: 16S rRNA (cytosine(1402)-N(4))-methyltransferase RsmH [Ignavibacteriales bacterium]|nr:16S rRNA (cytosine(1402)-N(4))-methyltransferase RsmH [Ignavibacteriales bacterium]